MVLRGLTSKDFHQWTRTSLASPRYVKAESSKSWGVWGVGKICKDTKLKLELQTFERCVRSRLPGSQAQLRRGWSMEALLVKQCFCAKAEYLAQGGGENMMGFWYVEYRLPGDLAGTWARDHLLPTPIENAPGAWGGGVRVRKITVLDSDLPLLFLSNSSQLPLAFVILYRYAFSDFDTGMSAVSVED